MWCCRLDIFGEKLSAAKSESESELVLSLTHYLTGSLFAISSSGYDTASKNGAYCRDTGNPSYLTEVQTRFLSPDGLRDK